MAGPPSAFLPPEAWGEPWELPAGEAHHLLTVLRLRPGDGVRLFDGAGREGTFTITGVSGKRARLEPLELTSIPRPPGPILAAGFSKSGRRTWLLEKAVEFGAGAIWFWQAERSQGRMPAEPKPSWREQLIAAAKQCGNPWLPELDVLPGGAAELARRGQDYPARVLLSEHESGRRFDPYAGPAPLLVAQGPEGGLAPSEVELLHAAGFAPVTLGPRILRLETAGLLALGLIFWADCGQG